MGGKGGGRVEGRFKQQYFTAHTQNRYRSHGPQTAASAHLQLAQRVRQLDGVRGGDRGQHLPAARERGAEQAQGRAAVEAGEAPEQRDECVGPGAVAMAEGGGKGNW